MKPLVEYLSAVVLLVLLPISLAAQTDCPSDVLITGEGAFHSQIGVGSFPERAGGAPDGLTTGTVSGSDLLSLSFPELKAGGEICVTLGFSSGFGKVDLRLNGQSNLISNPNSLGDYSLQKICITVDTDGPQSLVIKDEGFGSLRVDGSSFSSCPSCVVSNPSDDCDLDGVPNGEDEFPSDPCSAGSPTPNGFIVLETNDCDNDGITVGDGDLDDYNDCIGINDQSLAPSCDCPDNVIDGNGILQSSAGITNASNANGAPDGSFTSNISGNNDVLIFNIPNINEGGQICIILGFSNASSTARIVLNGTSHDIRNITGTSSYTAQEICIDVIESGAQVVQIKDGGVGNLRVDGLTYSYCPPCDINNNFQDCDGDGIRNGVDTAPNNPCTADGIVDGEEPSGFIAASDLDCDELTVDDGDQDDFDACIGFNESIASVECNCPRPLISGAGSLTDSEGVNFANKADGAPDGTLSGAISVIDIISFSFPFDSIQEVEGEVCVTLQFTNTQGEVRFVLPGNEFYSIKNNSGFNLHEICIPVKGKGDIHLEIRDVRSGIIRIDGTSFSYCSPDDSNIIPTFDTPGKVDSVLNPALSSLADQPVDPNFLTSNDVYRFNDDKVLIEAIVLADKVSLASNVLDSLGLTGRIDNGENNLIISGFLPVENLHALNQYGDCINFARNVYRPVANKGLVTSLGDRAQGSEYVKGGYDITGAGSKIGIISDSYNALQVAQNDINNGDLPLEGVDVLLDGDFIPGITDEGRAMLQIVHDVAPGAELAFKTGFISAGSFARSIVDLAEADCDIIIDDVTYITEPFFTDGLVAQAVEEVVSRGVTYVSAAGNYGENAYTSTFNAAPAPLGLRGVAHDFGNGDVFQRVTFKPGKYTISIQWEDDFYSIGQIQNGGAQLDLDVYLIDDDGSIRYNRNFNNIDGDPLEIMDFEVVNTPATTNFVIVNPDGRNVPVRFKYIFFRGGSDAEIEEYRVGTSTLVGQANADNAIAVGAVLYLNTPSFG